MATEQTGLGWYANEDWLMDEAGEIGKISTGANYGYVVVPLTWTSSIIYGVNPNSSVIYVNGYVVSGSYEVRLYLMSRGGGGVTPLFVSQGAFSVNYYAGNNSQERGVNYNSGFDSASGLYCAFYSSDFYNLYTTFTPSIDIIENSGVADYTAAARESLLKITQQGDTTVFSKSVNGYSVVCLCEWNATVGGNTYISPVLISSEQNNTIYTRNTSTPSVPATEHTYQGMTFYMRKAPLDVFDPSATITTDYSVVVLTNPSVGITNDDIFNAIRLASGLGVGYPPQPSDPYGPGGTSEPGISEGTFDTTSDIIVDSNTPTYSFSGTGFSRIYNPSLAQLRALASYLWTDTTFLQTIINHGKQLLENPMEAIISLSLLPCSVPHSTTAEEVKVMYVGTGVDMYPATTQFVDVDCGTLLIDKFYDSALDFNPYTTVSLFLPFIGMVDLDADEVMGRYLQVKYRVDIISGACVAKVFVSDEDGISYSCRYQFNGDCAVSMPLNSADFSGYRAAFIAAATAVTMGTMAAVGGAGGMLDAAMYGGVETASAPGVSETPSTALTVVPQGGALQERVRSVYGEPTQNTAFVDSVNKIADVVTGSMANLVSTVMGGKMHFQHASGFGGNAGMLGIRRPFVVIKRPRMCNPDEYGVYNGRPCQMYLSLGTISGFTQVGNVHLTGIPATIPELNEIAGFLKSGVIL